MAPTRVGTLIGYGLVAVPVGWLLGRWVRSASGVLPPVPWVLVPALVFLVILLLLTARAVRGWVQERRYDRWMDALRVARLLALGKAAALFGGLLAGGYLGLATLTLESLHVAAVRNRAITALVVAAAGVAVAGAGLRLERACMVPPDEDAERDETGSELD